MVAWPSVVNGLPYSWINGGPLTSTPTWIVDKINNQSWTNTPIIGAGGRGNENITITDELTPITNGQARDMVMAIDPNAVSYDEWLRIGLAIKSQMPDDRGLSLWDEWSRGGERYKRHECEKRWSNLQITGAVGVGTLFYHAKLNGWTPADTDVKSLGITELVAQMNQDYAIVMLGGKCRVIVEVDVLGCHSGWQRPFNLWDLQSFASYMKNQKYPVDTSKGVKEMQKYDLWMQNEARRTYPNGMGMFPDYNVPEGTFNTWRGFTVRPKEGDCGLFLSHVLNVLCRGEEEHWAWLMDWVADIVQDPANPKGCAVVVQGEEGTGKGTFASVIGSLFGTHYVQIIDTDHLTSNFNSHMADALVVFADEVTWGGNVKTAGKLKGLVSEKNLLVERKGVDAVQCKNMVHLIMVTNNEWAVPTGQGSRRWFALKTDDSKASNEKYFNAIYDELNNGGREALLYFLLNRRITSNLKVAPVTSELKHQRILSTNYNSAIEWWARKVMEGRIESPGDQDFDPNNTSIKWPEVVDASLLYAEYESYCLLRRCKILNVISFGMEMSKMGIKRTDRHSKKFRILPLEEAAEAIRQTRPGAIE
jgi:hypothetical protein